MHRGDTEQILSDVAGGRKLVPLVADEVLHMKPARGECAVRPGDGPLGRGPGPSLGRRTCRYRNVGNVGTELRDDLGGGLHLFGAVVEAVHKHGLGGQSAVKAVGEPPKSRHHLVEVQAAVRPVDSFPGMLVRRIHLHRNPVHA